MFSFFFYIVFAGLGITVLSVCYSKIAIHRKVKHAGLYVRGTITGRKQSIIGYTPVIRFRTASGKEVEGVARNLGKVRDLFNPGDRIDLYYLPENETVFVVDLFLLNLFLYIGLIAGSLMSLFVLASLVCQIIELDTL